MMKNLRALGILIFLVSLLTACAQQFPRPILIDCAGSKCADQLSGTDIFRKTFQKHGGDYLNQLNDLNVSIDGNWKFLITRIQPLVTDHRYRVKSQERLLPNKGVYSACYQGPDGSKKVIRSTSDTRVFYDNIENFDKDILQSSALTADSFFIFSLAPLALSSLGERFIRLQDKEEKGMRYHRIYAVMEPGIGYSERDEIVLWIDPVTYLTYRVHITLEGYRTTQGAHVDVTYRDYKKLDKYIFPSVFHERVLGPISIDAHSWWLTGIDINRGLNYEHINQQPWPAKTSAPANAYSN